MEEKENRYERMLKNGSVWRAIFTMAVPALATIVIMIFYNMADMFFIAQLGDTAKVASVSIISPVFGMIMALATMIGVGGSAMIASAFGAGHKEDAKNTASLCFYSSLVIAVIVTVLLTVFKEPLLKVLGTKPEMWEDSRMYLQVLALGTVFMLVSSMMGMLVRSEGAVKEGMVGNLAGTVTNLILDPLFILVFRWGVAGAAAATVIGNIVSCTFYMVFIVKKAEVINIEPARALVNPSAIFQIFLLGLPNAASTILSGFAGTFGNNLLSGHGTEFIAAAAGAGRSSLLISMVQMGICMGVQPLMGYTYGSRQKERLKEVLQKTALLTGCIGAGTMVFCFVFRSFIISLFLKDPAVAAMGEYYMMFIMAGAPFLGIVYIATNYLQATKEAAGAIVVSLLRQGLLLIPLLYILDPLFGFTGIAAAHTAADILAALISLVIFFIVYRRNEAGQDE